jgi:hypothetical protein
MLRIQQYSQWVAREKQLVLDQHLEQQELVSGLAS